MLDLLVQPELSIGNEQWSFILGMPLFQAVQILQNHCRVIKSVEVIYHDRCPMESDLILNLTSDGIRLIFDPRNQRLRIIEVYDVSKVKLKYYQTYFNSPPDRPSPEQIEQTFGATRPGQFDKGLQRYVMGFRGLTFFFDVDAQFESYFTKHPNTHPATSSLPPGCVPSVSKMCIYSGSHWNDNIAPEMPLSCYQGNLYLASADVMFEGKEATGLQLVLKAFPDNSAEVITLEKKINFGDNVQHVLSEIGSPCKVFYKSHDKMRIHSSSPRKLNETRNTDYFYNYFTLGIDVAFDGKLHQVKKFLLHTNFPGHYNFNIYHRCNFKVKLSEDISDEEDGVDVEPCTKWSAITRALGCDVGKPVVINRSSSTNNTNPFGPTFCYGLRNLIFEVMSNDHIASVTMYKPHQTTSTTS